MNNDIRSLKSVQNVQLKLAALQAKQHQLREPLTTPQTIFSFVVVTVVSLCILCAGEASIDVDNGLNAKPVEVCNWYFRQACNK